MKNRVLSITNNILAFLKESNINNWTDFNNMEKFDYDIINNLISHEAESGEEIKEIKFNIRLQLSNNKQLNKYIKQLELEEDYEMCDIVMRKIQSNK